MKPEVRYRTEAFSGSGERDAAKVMAFETFELGNTDILEHLAGGVLKGTAIMDTMVAFVDELDRNGFIDDMPESAQVRFFRNVLDEIEKQTGVCVRYALWLADKDVVTDRTWYGRDMNDDQDFESYETGEIVLSDLGRDGTLYGYSKEPVSLESQLAELQERRVDIINEREGVRDNSKRAIELDNLYVDVDNQIQRLSMMIAQNAQPENSQAFKGEITMNNNTPEHDQQHSIDLFEKFLAFKQETGITSLSVVQVMADLHNEINVSSEDLYTLAVKLIDGIYSTDDPFLYGERIAAIQTISDHGFSNSLYLADMSPDDAFQFLLTCPPDIFIAAVDAIARENQEYFTAEWGPETGHDALMDKVNNYIEKFLVPPENLDDRIASAAQRSGGSASLQEDGRSVETPEREDGTGRQ